MYDSYTSNILEVKGMSAKIHSIVEEQMALGVKPENIIIGGFSQGGALALYASLNCQVRIGETCILSSFIIFQVPSLWEAHYVGILSNIHSDYRVRQYRDLGHEVNDAVQHDLALFISKIVSK